MGGKKQAQQNSASSSSSSEASSSAHSSSSDEEVQDLSSPVQSSSSSSNSEEESHKSAGDSGSAVDKEEEDSSSSVDDDDNIMGGGSDDNGSGGDDEDSVEIIVKPKQAPTPKKNSKGSKIKETPAKSKGKGKDNITTTKGKKEEQKKSKGTKGKEVDKKKKKQKKQVDAGEDSEDAAVTSSTEGTSSSGKKAKKAPTIPKTPVAAAMHAISHMNFWRQTHGTANSKKERNAMFNRLVNFDQDGNLAESIRVSSFCACPKSCSMDLDIFKEPPAKQIKCDNWCGKCGSRLVGSAATGIPQYSFPIKPAVNTKKDKTPQQQPYMQHPSNTLLNDYSSRPVVELCADNKYDALLAKMAANASLNAVTTAEGVTMLPIGTPLDLYLVYTFNRDAQKYYQLVPDFLASILLQLPERTYPTSAKSKKSDLFPLEQSNKWLDSVETPNCNGAWNKAYKQKFGRSGFAMTIIADARANKARLHKIPSLEFGTPERTSVVIKKSVADEHTVVSLKGKRYGLVAPGTKLKTNWFIRNPNAFWNALNTYVTACGVHHDGDIANVAAPKLKNKTITTTGLTIAPAEPAPSSVEKKKRSKKGSEKEDKKDNKASSSKKGQKEKKEKEQKKKENKKVSQRPKETPKPPAKEVSTKKRKSKKPTDEIMEDPVATATAVEVTPVQVVKPTRKRGRQSEEKTVEVEPVLAVAATAEPEFIADNSAICTAADPEVGERPTKRAKLPTVQPNDEGGVTRTDKTDTIMNLLHELTSETKRQALSLEALDQLVSSNAERQINFADAGITNLDSALQLVQQRISDNLQQEIQQTLEAQEKRHQTELQSVMAQFKSVCSKFDQVADFLIANDRSAPATSTTRRSPSPTTVTWNRRPSIVDPVKVVDNAVANAAGNVGALLPLINGQVTKVTNESPKQLAEGPNLDSPLASEDYDGSEDSVDSLDNRTDEVIETAPIKRSAQPIAPLAPTTAAIPTKVVGYDETVEPTPSTILRDTPIKPTTVTTARGNTSTSSSRAKPFELSSRGVGGTAQASAVTTNRLKQMELAAERRRGLQQPTTQTTQTSQILNTLMPNHRGL